MSQTKLHVRKGDRVKVIAGKDRGLVGEVIAVYPEKNRVTVAGVNVVKRHLKDTANQPQSRQVNKGGIVSSEAPIHASNVQLVVKNAGGDEVVTRASSLAERDRGEAEQAKRMVDRPRLLGPVVDLRRLGWRSRDHVARRQRQERNGGKHDLHPRANAV